MTIDIFYSGIISNILVKIRSKKFFNSPKYINRNNVFVDTANDNVYHLKTNSVHIFLSSDDISNISDVCVHLKLIFKNNLIGIKSKDSLFIKLNEIGTLNLLRM